MTCLSSRSMSALLSWRNPQGKEENWLDQPFATQAPTSICNLALRVTKITLGQVGSLLITLVAAVETAVYLIITALAYTLKYCTNRPFNFSSKLLESSLRTIKWGINNIPDNFTFHNVPTSEHLAKEWSIYRGENRDLEAAIHNHCPIPITKLFLHRSSQRVIDDGITTTTACSNKMGMRNYYDPDAQIKSRFKYFLLAAFKENAPIEIIRLLLEKGADPNFQSDDPDKHSLLVALQQGCRKEVIYLLLEKGAKAEHAIPYALRKGYPLEVIRHLLEAGGDPNYGRSYFNYPPLLTAIQKKLPSPMIYLLLEKGAKANEAVPEALKKDYPLITGSSRKN